MLSLVLSVDFFKITSYQAEITVLAEDIDGEDIWDSNGPEQTVGCGGVVRERMEKGVDLMASDLG